MPKNSKQPELLASLREEVTILSPDRGRVLSFDREGRLRTYHARGCTYLRSLASAVQLRYRDRKRRRALLEDDEALDIFREAYALARAIAPRLEPRERHRIEEEILPWSPARLAAERERFEALYRPIAILPPDQYLAIALQASEGCSWNRCTFCSWYLGRPFAASSPERFRRHAEGVRDFLGRGALLRRGIFLADGNALALAPARLDPLIEIARQVFPGRSLFGFVDLHGGQRRSARDWGALARRGLERVYIGMESGLDELLALVNKPATTCELLDFVATLQGAGLKVAPIVLVGLGGHRYRRRHLEATLAALRSMSLGAGDLVYLSPLVLEPGSAHRSQLGEAGIDPLSEQEIETDLRFLATALRKIQLRASRYDIRDFFY